MIFPGAPDGIRLGLGGAPLGNMYRAMSEPAAQAVLVAALADGCVCFDTAPHYGQGLSELRFGQALRALPRDRFVISSKVGRLLSPDARAPREQNGFVDVLPFAQRWDFSARGVRRSVEDSLQRLGLARLDVVFIHDCDARNHGERYPQVLQQVLGQALPELHRMRAEGLLGHIGLGVNEVQVCLDVLRGQSDDAAIDCLLLAGRYSLLDQSALAQLLPACLDRGVKVLLGGVFNSGILATGVLDQTGSPNFNYGPAAQPWIERTAAIERLCRRHGVALRAAALQFALAHPAVELLLAGAQSPEQWIDSVSMLGRAIPAEFWRELRHAGLIEQDAPVPGDP